MPIIKHIHTLIKAKIAGGGEWFMCNNSYCRYREQKGFLVGKVNQCDCGEVFILTKSSLSKARPTCPNCMRSRKEKRKQEMEIKVHTETKDIVNELFEK